MNQKAPWDNDAFVVLMRIAEETPAIRQQLSWIVQLPVAERNALLDPWLYKLEESGMPADVIEAIRSLRNETFASAVSQFLAGNHR